MFCKNCGKEISDQAAICVHCGVATSTTGINVNTTSSSDGSLGCLLGGVCFLIPIVGIILYFLWLSTMPRKAKSAGLISLISIILGVIGYLLIVVIGVAAGAAGY